MKRLVSTENQLKRNDERAAAYSEAINQYIQDGYAEEVIDDSSEVEKRLDTSLIMLSSMRINPGQNLHSL